MTATPSLQGKRVLVPRGEKQAKSFSEEVIHYGGVPVEIPLLAFRPKQDTGKLQSYLQNLSSYDWVIFTSKVAVETFFTFLDKESLLKLPKIAVIGKKTREELLRRGMKVDFTPTEYVAESFAREFSPLVKGGDRIILPKGNLARDYIALFLRERGATVDEVVIYETYFPDKSKKKLVESLRKRELDILAFTSPSTVDHFMTVVGEYSLHEHISDCLVACIGPVAKKRAEDHGLKVAVMPETYTTHDLIKSVVYYLNRIG